MLEGNTASSVGVVFFNLLLVKFFLVMLAQPDTLRVCFVPELIN